MLRLSLPVIAALLPCAVPAAEVRDCVGPETHAWKIAEPWEDATRTFANGEVRIAVLDTVEPATTPFHLMILSPPRDELGLRRCRVVSMAVNPAGAASGFAELSLDGMASHYDPNMGLLLDLPAAVFNPVTTGFDPATLRVVVNQATGAVTAKEIAKP